MSRELPPLLAPLFASSGRCRLRNARSGAVLASRLEAAMDSRSRRRGLLGRDSMAAGDALLLAPCNSVHTFFMRFPIDVLFVRRDGSVVKCARVLHPWRIALAPRAYAALEFPAGTLQATETRPGDFVVIEPAG